MRFGSRCRAEASGKVTDTDVRSATGSSPDGVERDLGIWLWLAGPTPAFGSRNQLKYEVSGEPNNRYVGLDITIVGMSVTRHSEQPQPEETAACGGRSGRKAVRHDRLGAAGAVRHRRHVRASLASVRNSVFGSARDRDCVSTFQIGMAACPALLSRVSCREVSTRRARRFPHSL